MRSIFRHSIKDLLDPNSLIGINRYLTVRLASSDANNPLGKFKLISKTEPTEAKKAGIVPGGEDEANLVKKSDSSLQKYDDGEGRRGLVARLLRLPAKTPALEDKLPNAFYLEEERRQIATWFPFYQNLMIYDYPELPHVKHSELKLVKTEYHGVLEAKFDEDIVWLPIFRIPHVTRWTLILYFKLFLSGLSGGFCIRELYRFTDKGVFYDVAPAMCLAGITSVGLAALGNIYRQLVVQIYTSEDLQYLRFSRFTFWGRRRDIVVPVKYVRPLTETNPTMRAPFYRLNFIKPATLDLDNDFVEFYDVEFKILVMFGGLRDRHLFEEVLGKLLRNKVGA